VAYLVAKNHPAPPVTALRRLLAESLPAPMVPSVFVTLDALPLTANGKVDYQALPAPLSARPHLENTYLPARDPLQLLLVRVWEEILGVRPVGTRDDFFALGGDSLLAARMLARVEQLCGKIVLPSALEEGATIEHLSLALLRQEFGQAPSLLTEVHPGDPRQRFFYLHGDFNGGGFYCFALAHHLGADQPLCQLHPHGLAGQAVPATVEEMAEDHLAALRSFQPEGPYRLGDHCNGALVAFEMARQLRAQGQVVDPPILIGADVSGAPRQPLDWELESRLRQFLEPHNRAPAKGDLTAWEDRRWHLFAVYRWALQSYAPRPYPGRIIVFRPHEHPLRAGDPSMGWSRVAESVQTYVIPGSHLSCLTEHVAALAEQLRACLSLKDARFVSVP
jgi:thioesterase domain-containing protein